MTYSNQLHWKQIWQKRNISGPVSGNFNDKLQRLIHIDGFDNALSDVSSGDWQAYVRDVLSKLGSSKGQSVFEVGCGAGAFLICLQNDGYETGGIDFSEAMIEEARKHLVSDDINACDGALFDDSRQYDIVLSNSAFFYFEDHDYSGRVLKKMLRKARKSVAILDVPDVVFKDECERIRENTIQNYHQLYRDKGIQHLYYSKQWFLEFAEHNACDVLFYAQNMNNYGHAPFRFNCILWKHPTKM